MLDLKFENKIRNPFLAALQTKQNISSNTGVADCNKIVLSTAVPHCQIQHRTVVLRHLPCGWRINMDVNRVWIFRQTEKKSFSPSPHFIILTRTRQVNVSAIWQEYVKQVLSDLRCQKSAGAILIPTTSHRSCHIWFEWQSCWRDWYVTPPNVNFHLFTRFATGYGLVDRGIRVWVAVGSRIFSPPRRPHRLWGPPNLLPNRYRGGGLFPRG
jgi:hypothetical protein